MKLSLSRPKRIGATLAFLLIAACSPSAAPVGSGDDGGGDGPGGGGGGGDGGSGEDGGPGRPPEPPHALGSVVVGEARMGSDPTPAPFVSAAFLPDVDAARAAACTKIIAGCDVTLMPSCGDTGCGSGEMCTYDASCAPTCKKTCTPSCDTDQVCVGIGGSPHCELKPAFDAGHITIEGATFPIALDPPLYSFSAPERKAPFREGADLRIVAAGAKLAGFASFDEHFSGTTPMKTSPALASLAPATFAGTGAVHIGWVAGADRARVTLSGRRGTAVCEADDAKGGFDIAREIIAAVAGTDEASVTVGVERRRVNVKKDKTTTGTLPNATVQPVGWLELATSSRESASFVSCGDKKKYCATGCTDTSADKNNCGACENACENGAGCKAGKCITCNECISTVATAGACKADVDACKASQSCIDYRTCCGGPFCPTSCATQYPAGAVLNRALEKCVARECAGVCNK